MDYSIQASEHENRRKVLSSSELSAVDNTNNSPPTSVQVNEKVPTTLRINVEEKVHSKHLQEIEKPVSMPETDELVNQVHWHQNVKPLKKRTRLCTSYRDEEVQESQQGQQEKTKNSSPPLPERPDSNQLVDQKEETIINDDKDKKKRSSFTCKICVKSFFSRSSYRQHIRSHDGCFKCNVCGKVMKTKDSLYHHQRGLHSKEKPYHCKECGIAFNFYHSYKLHLQRHNGERPHKCKYCEKSYLTLNHLKEHIQAIHSNTCIVCHICGRKFSYLSTLKLHLRRHSGNLPHKCSVCLRKFLTKQALKIHAASHIQERNFQCEACGKCFKTEGSRDFHSKKHKKIPKHFMCDICGKTFLYKCILNSHAQIHSKLRPYVCDICDKGFKSKASLYTHQYYVHKDGLTLPCSTCGKSFKTKSRLAAHVRRHQNKDVFVCATCGGTFPDKAGLNKHVKTIHLPHKCFVCKICGKTGSRADNMRTHIKKHKNEISANSNPMDFIREELELDRLTDFQNRAVKVKHRKRELYSQSTGSKLHPEIAPPAQNRWIQARPVTLQINGQHNARPPNPTSSIKALPSLSQSQGTLYHNTQTIGECEISKGFLSGHSKSNHYEQGKPTNHEQGKPTYYEQGKPTHYEQGKPTHYEQGKTTHYELGNTHYEQGKPTHYEQGTPTHYEQGKTIQYEQGKPTYYYEQGKTTHHVGHFPHPDQIDRHNGHMPTIMSSLNGPAIGEPGESSQYSFVITPNHYNYRMDTGSFHTTEQIAPRSYEISQEKTITSLQNVLLNN